MESLMQKIQGLKWQNNEGNASQSQIDSYRVAIDDVLAILDEAMAEKEKRKIWKDKPSKTGYYYLNRGEDEFVEVLRLPDGDLAIKEGTQYFSVDKIKGKWRKVNGQV